MRTKIFFQWLLSISSTTLIAASAPAQISQNANATSPPPVSATPDKVAPYTVVERGPHHRHWARITSQSNQIGKVSYRTNSYTEIEAGMHHMVNGQWVESTTDIQITPTGAQATNGQHQVNFAANINTPVAIDLTTPEGKHLSSHILGLSYLDAATGSNVLIAEIKDSIGQLVPPNQVIYTNAFTDFDADVRYTYTKSGFVQDVLINQNLPGPNQYGLNSQSSHLQLLTEFINPPNPVILTNQSEGSIDETLDFGMVMGPGKAFSFGNLADPGLSVPVTKQWLVLQGRTFLVEDVEYQATAAQLQQLPANTTASLKPRGGSLLHRVAAQRVLPVPKFAKGKDNPIRKAASASSHKGFVLDYSLMTIGRTNFTFQSDTTYYVNGNFTLGGTNFFEGGAVIKYATNASLIATPTLIPSKVVWLGSAYRPVIMTAKDDNTVGEALPGSTGTPTGYYASTALSLAGSGNATINYFRISYAAQAFAGAGSTHSLSDGQIVNCQNGVHASGVTISVRNVLFANVKTNFNDANGAVLDAQNVTFSGSAYLITVPNTNGPTLRLTNCILSQVTNLVSLPNTSLNGDHNGFYNTAQFGANPLANATNPFQTVGGASYYLADQSGLRNAGTTGISSSTLADIRQKTTYPPVVIDGGTNGTFYTNSLALFPQAQRDSDAPDIGYHYDPLDYAFGYIYLTNATITAGPGTAIAMYAPNVVDYGIALSTGSRFTATGSPTNLVHIVSYNTVQEQSNTNWSRSAYEFYVFGTTTTPQAQATFRFTDWSILAQDGYHWYDDSGLMSPVTFQDCQFHGGLIDNNAVTPNYTNCLFERVSIVMYEYPYTLATTLRNSLFIGGKLDMAAVSTNWLVKDNFFDRTSIPAEGSLFADGHNGYVTNYDRVNASGTGDVILTNSPAYQVGPLGNYYYPTNLPLINAGSTTADLVGLYHYTTTTNEVKETNSTVDIGFHYVAVNGSGQPDDTDGDGFPDYLEDANGNGTVDSGETDWQSATDLGLKVIITNPKNNSVIP